MGLESCLGMFRIVMRFCNDSSSSPLFISVSLPFVGLAACAFCLNSLQVLVRGYLN